MASVSKAGAEDRVKALYYIMQSAEVNRVLLFEGRGAGSRSARTVCKCCDWFSVLVLQSKLGGGEGIEGLYGSLTRTGMQKVLHSLSKSCGLDKTSRLVDIGAGLGRYVAMRV